MITVPAPVLNTLAGRYATTASHLAYFGGGREESDGIVYAYPYEDRRRLLKILAIPTEDRRTGLFCLDERLQFVRFLGDHGARIVFPQRSPRGRLYETVPFEAHTWIGYGMEIAPGKAMNETTWDPAIFRNWGRPLAGYIAWPDNIIRGKRPWIRKAAKHCSPGRKSGQASSVGVRMTT